jgi:hypothetical protein
MPGYHTVLVEQHMKLMMEATGVTSTTDHGRRHDDYGGPAGPREGHVVYARQGGSGELRGIPRVQVPPLLANGGRYKPLRTHLENGHTEGKRPYPSTVEGMKTLMVDYRVPGVAVPTTTERGDDHQGVAFTETLDDWKKDVTCFDCGGKGHLIGKSRKTTEEERQRKMWVAKEKEFNDRDDTSTSTKKRGTKKTGVLNQAVEVES